MAATSSTMNLEKVTRRMHELWQKYEMATRQNGIAPACFLRSCTQIALAPPLVRPSK